MFTFNTIQIINNETLFQQNIQTNKQSHNLLEIEVINVTTTFLVQQLERQQTEQHNVNKNHIRSQIANPTNQLVKTQPYQQQKKQKQPNHSCPQTQQLKHKKNQLLTINHFKHFNLNKLIFQLYFQQQKYKQSSNFQLTKKKNSPKKSIKPQQCYQNS